MKAMKAAWRIRWHEARMGQSGNPMSGSSSSGFLNLTSMSLEQWCCDYECIYGCIEIIERW